MSVLAVAVVVSALAKCKTSYLKFFVVMGKVLTGKLSCKGSDPVVFQIPYPNIFPLIEDTVTADNSTLRNA